MKRRSKLLLLLIAFTMSFGISVPAFAATKDTTSPFIKTIYPTNNQFNVLVNQTITITFNEDISKGKTFSNIILSDAEGFEIIYKVKIDKNKLSIRSSTIFNYGSKYKLILPVGSIIDKSGNSLKKSFSFSFNTIKADNKANAKEMKLSVKDIAKKADAVVYIEVKDKNNKNFASGSGFIVNGKIVTNYHVIDESYSATITTNDEKTYNVTGVYSYDKDNDLAVLRVGESILPSVVLADSNKISVGEKVIAIGSPIGLQNTVSEGIISSIRKGTSSSIQISVPINHGSSGGALFNEYGKVIGITTAGYDTTGDLNFAIPINLVKPMLDSKSVVSLKDVYNDLHTIIYSDSKYEGEIINGKENGLGIMVWDDGTIYNGNWKNGYTDGQGTMTWENGENYDGLWKNGKRNGQGTYTWINGDVYIGEFKDGEFDGHGTLFYANGEIKKGNWTNGNFVSSSDTSTNLNTENASWLYEKEPNSFLDNANILPQDIFINGSLSNDSDIDTFKIEVSQTGYYDIWSQIGADGLFCNNYYVLLYDSNDKFIADAKCSSYFDNNNKLTYSNFLYKYYLTEGTYYIHVLPKSEIYFTGLESLSYSLIFNRTK